jgi:hypothetical protein
LKAEGEFHPDCLDTFGVMHYRGSEKDDHQLLGADTDQSHIDDYPHDGGNKYEDGSYEYADKSVLLTT